MGPDPETRELVLVPFSEPLTDEELEVLHELRARTEIAKEEVRR